MSNPSKTYIQDVISDSNIPWSELQDSTVTVTGATGLVGGLVIRTLFAANQERGLNIRLIAHGRNADRGNVLSQEFGAEFVSGNIRKPPLLKGVEARLDYIFHCAAITKSADMVARPADVISTEIEGTKNVLELARKTHCRSLVYLSSMEVYGQTAQGEVKECDLGYIDLSNPRSCYPESKRLCEMMCTANAAQYGLPIKIARLARTFGPGVPNVENDMRIANQFTRKALAGEDIELHTPGNSIANCCDTIDAVRGLLTILLKGKNGEAYNVANPKASTTIHQMAEVVANEVCGGKIKVKIAIPEDIDQRGYAPDVGFRLNADKLLSLGWSPGYGIKEMYQRMLADWNEC